MPRAFLMLLPMLAAPVDAGFFRVAPTLPLPGPALPRRSSAVAGDFNGDGIPDLAISHEAGNGNETGGLAVFLGAGAGSFAPALYSSPTAIGWVQGATADINEDGHADLAVATGGGVSVMFGDGAGHFSETVVGGLVPACHGCEGFEGVAIADVDGDANLDLVAVRQIRFPDLLPPRLWVRRGDGLGNFATPAEYALAASVGRAGQVAVGDLNGDGRTDVAIAQQAGLVAVCLNDGSGAFPGVTFLTTGPLGSDPYGMLLADVDADGKLDLAVANGNIPGLVIFRGNGAGGFGAPLQFPAPRSFHSSLVAADFDLDGHLDLALQASGLWIYRGDGTGNFVVAARFGVVGPEGEGGSVAAGADLDGDGRVDLAVGRALLFNHPGWDFGAQRQFPVGLLPKAVAAGDMNDDGKTDLVTANAGSHDISVILGNGDGSFGPPIPGPLISSALDLEIADFDGDGHQDVALPDYDASTLRVFRGNGAGGLLSQTTLLLGPGAQPTDVAVGDVNGDGRLDLAVACLGSNSVQIFLGTGGASFVPAPGYFFQRAQAVAFALLNPDVRPDLLVGQAWDGTSSYTALSSLMGSGDGLFLSPQPADAELGAVATLSPGDFDGDGDLDLAVTGAPLGTAVLRGDGFGGFGERQFPVGPEQLKGEYGVASAVSDFNRDGIMDLITDDVGLATGYGDGTFGLLNERFEVGENASALAVADFDGDGYRDVAAAVASANAVTVLLNAPPTTAGADLSVTIAHAPDPATSGAPLVYTIVVSNAGPLAADAVSLRFRSQALPVASSNPGPPTCVLTNVKGEDGFMDCFLGTLAPGASVVVTAVVDVPAGSNGAGLVSDAIVGAATLDLDPNDNRAAHLVSVGPGPADLAVTLADSADPVAPGTPFSYLVTMSNVGTVAVPYSALLDWLPEQVTFVSSNPPICGGGTNPLACNLPPLGVGATFTITINVVAGTFTTVENVVTVVGDFEPDTSNNTAVEATRGALGIARELGHGSSLSEAFPPGTPAERLYYIRQNPHASYEVAVDATAGDVAGPGQTLSLQRLDVDLSPVQDAVAAGAGPSRALRWENASGQAIDAEVVRARSTGCSAACGPGDSYRIRANETTARISRFNTSGTQTTVLLLENATDRPVQGHAWLWDTGGQGVGTLTFNLDAHRTWAVNLASVAPGRNGSITISHNGPTGALGGKAVAIEPATGFTFDTALEYRRR